MRWLTPSVPYQGVILIHSMEHIMLRNLILTIWCWIANQYNRPSITDLSVTFTENHCYWVDETPSDWHLYHWYTGPGWYYADEAGLMNGAYKTRKDAEAGLVMYTTHQLRSTPCS